MGVRGLSLKTLYRKAADATLDNSHGYQAGMYGLQKLITTMFNIYA